MSYTRALISVLSDLTQFLLGSGGKRALPAPSAMTLPAPIAPLALGSAEVDESLALLQPLSTHTTAYSAYAATPLYQRPVRALDTVLITLPYATKVVAERHEGQFTQVLVGTVRGWVHKDALIYNELDIFPQLQAGQQYDAYHTATAAVRRLLSDPFAAAGLGLPLLPGEYVTYRLYQEGRAIAWSSVRPRPAGRWHEMLRGVSGIQSGAMPRTGALVEWVDDEGEGALRFVEAVHPDRSVVVSGIIDSEGRYDTVRLTESGWQSLRPVFIMVA